MAHAPTPILETAFDGAWTADEATRFLAATATPMRLAANGASGFPILTPLWFEWTEGALWAAAKPDAAIVRALRKDPRATFEISIESPPYKGVRGRGLAEILPDGLPVLKRLLARYMAGRGERFQARLLAASPNEIAIRIRPNRLTSWDFSKRMAD